MNHYLVMSPQMSFVDVILEDGTGPTEYYACAAFVEAENEDDAKAFALKMDDMKDWVQECQVNDENPFVGLTVDDCKCEHGKCWCESCTNKFGECDACIEEYEKAAV